MRTWGVLLRSAGGALAAMLLLYGLGGCAPELTARRAARGTVSGFAEGLADVDPAIRRKLHDTYLNDQDIQQAARTLTASLVLGTADGLQQAHLDKLAGSAVAATMKALREQGGPALSEMVNVAGPELDRALRTAIRDSIVTAGAALRQSASRDMAAATRTLVRAAVDGTLESLARFARGQDGETRRYATETLAPSAGLVMRTMMREAVAGAREGVDQASQGKRPPIRELMREVGAGLAEGMKEGVADSGKFQTLLISVLVVLGALLVGAVAGTYVLWRRYQRTTRSLILFARQINDSRKTNEDYARQLREAIHEAHVRNKSDVWLDDFLSHRGL